MFPALHRRVSHVSASACSLVGETEQAAIASPEEVAPTLNHVERLTSALLAHAGDIPAADMTWYTKRMLLGGVIGLAEVQLASGEGSLEEVLDFVETSLDKVGM